MSTDQPSESKCKPKTVLIFISYIVTICGFAELIISGIAISYSSAFGAAWYTGLACLFSGSQGLRVTRNETLTRGYIKWVTAVALFSIVLSIFGSALDGANFLLFNSLEACASSSSALSESCGAGISQNLQCVGDSTYFSDAVTCAGSPVNGCSCVTSSDTCHADIEGFPSCLFIITDFSKLLKVSFALCLCCLLSSILLLVSSASMWICSSDVRDSSLSDPLNGDAANVIPTEAAYAYSMRESQIPVNVSFVEVRPNAFSDVGSRGSMAPIMVRPSGVHEVERIVPNSSTDATVSPIITAVPLHQVL